MRPTIVTFAALESARSQYKACVPIRDGFSPEQQIAMATIHNQQVAGGSPRAIAVILCKPTLRALWNKGVIDENCRLTKKGDDIVIKWSKESKK